MMRIRALLALLKEAINSFLTENCPHLAGGIAYYFLLSLFPLILGFVSIAGFILRSPEIEKRLVESLAGFIPVSSELIAGAIKAVIDARGITGIIAAVGLLWAGSSVFNAVRKAINAAWGIKTPRPFLIERLLEAGMMFGMGILFLLSFGLTTFLQVIRRLDIEVLGGFFSSYPFLWNILGYLVSFSLIFVVFLFLYRFIPNTKVRWRDVWLGAFLGAFVFEVAKHIFVWYITNFAHHNLVYGPFSGLIIFLLWVYVSVFIMLLFAKFSSIYPRVREVMREGKGEPVLPHIGDYLILAYAVFSGFFNMIFEPVKRLAVSFMNGKILRR